MTPEQVRTVERLREAAREHGEVHDLLCVLSSTLLLDSDMQIVGDADEINYLKAVLVAADFASYDRGRE